VFWVYVSKALFHGLLCYYLPMFAFGVADPSGMKLDSWWHSSLSFTLLLHVVTFKLFVDVRQWNLLSVLTSLSSLVFYYVTVIIINSPAISEGVQPQIMGVFSNLLNNPKAWLLILGAPFFCLLPDISIKIFSTWWARTPVDWELKRIDDAKGI
jgi:magnesium-transporting ATPase (P-type)